MQLSSTLKSPLKIVLLSTLAIFVLASCSSSQAVYDDDGIYNGSSTVSTDEEPKEETSATDQVYKNYFEQEADALGDIIEEDAIFTDVDEYSSEDGGEGAYVYEEGTSYETGRGAWGDETENVYVNVYNNSPFWGYGGFGFGYGWGYYRPFLGYGYGFYGPYFGYGNFYRPFIGFGFGGFGYGYGFGGFYGNPYFNNGFYNGFRGGAIAYHRGRRASAATSRSAVATRNARQANTRRALANRGRARSTFSRNRGTTRPRTTVNSGRNGRGTVAGKPSNARPSRGVPSRGRPNTANRPSNTRPSNSATRSRGRTRPSANAPSRGTRTRGISRPSSRPSRPAARPSSRPSRPSARPSSRPSRPSARPSSSRRGGGGVSRGGGGRGRRG